MRGFSCAALRKGRISAGKGTGGGCWRGVCAPQQVCNNFLGLLLGHGRIGQVSPEGFSRGEPTLVLEVVLGTRQIWPCRGAHPVCVPVPWHQARASLGDVSSGW